MGKGGPKELKGPLENESINSWKLDILTATLEGWGRGRQGGVCVVSTGVAQGWPEIQTAVVS